MGKRRETASASGGAGGEERGEEVGRQGEQGREDEHGIQRRHRSIVVDARGCFAAALSLVALPLLAS